MYLDSEYSFDALFRQILDRTCLKWGYPFPDEEYFIEIYNRIPKGLRRAVAYGYQEGIILDAGSSKSGSAAFRPCLISVSKGPYSWFEKDDINKKPRPAWEYYIQLAEFVRLYEAISAKGYELRFEDDLMDIGIYEHGSLLVCCEVKEKSLQAQDLISGIHGFQGAAFFPEIDRGKDSLRKAKYISKLRPLYFYIVSIGRRYEFRVEYPSGMKFELVEDFIPII